MKKKVFFVFLVVMAIFLLLSSSHAKADELAATATYIPRPPTATAIIMPYPGPIEETIPEQPPYPEPESPGVISMPERIVNAVIRTLGIKNGSCLPR